MAVQDDLHWFPLRWATTTFWSPTFRRGVVNVVNAATMTALTINSATAGHLGGKFSSASGYRAGWPGFLTLDGVGDSISTVSFGEGGEEAVFDYLAATFSFALAWKGTGGLISKGANAMQYAAAAAGDGSVTFTVKGGAGQAVATLPAGQASVTDWNFGVFRHQPGAGGITIDLKRRGETAWRSVAGTGAAASLPNTSANLYVGALYAGSPIPAVGNFFSGSLAHLMAWSRRIPDGERDSIEDFIGPALTGGTRSRLRSPVGARPVFTG